MVGQIQDFGSEALHLLKAAMALAAVVEKAMPEVFRPVRQGPPAEEQHKGPETPGAVDLRGLVEFVGHARLDVGVHPDHPEGRRHGGHDQRPESVEPAEPPHLDEEGNEPERRGKEHGGEGHHQEGAMPVHAAVPRKAVAGERAHQDETRRLGDGHQEAVQDRPIGFEGRMDAGVVLGQRRSEAHRRREIVGRLHGMGGEDEHEIERGQVHEGDEGHRAVMRRRVRSSG